MCSQPCNQVQVQLSGSFAGTLASGLLCGCIEIVGRLETVLGQDSRTTGLPSLSMWLQTSSLLNVLSVLVPYSILGRTTGLGLSEFSHMQSGKLAGPCKALTRNFQVSQCQFHHTLLVKASHSLCLNQREFVEVWFIWGQQCNRQPHKVKSCSRDDASNNIGYFSQNLIVAVNLLISFIISLSYLIQE